MRNSRVVRRKLTTVPWMKLNLRMILILMSSRSRMRSLTVLRRSTSCRSSPRLLTSSTLRSVSVVDPASSLLSSTIFFCASRMLLLIR